MKCRTVMFNGTAAIFCGSARIAQKCACGQKAALLCDYPVPNRKTCDKPLCRRCARDIGNDRHYCPDHPRELDLFSQGAST